MNARIDLQRATRLQISHDFFYIFFFSWTRKIVCSTVIFVYETLRRPIIVCFFFICSRGKRSSFFGLVAGVFDFPLALAAVCVVVVIIVLFWVDFKVYDFIVYGL